MYIKVGNDVINVSEIQSFRLSRSRHPECRSGNYVFISFKNGSPISIEDDKYHTLFKYLTKTVASIGTLREVVLAGKDSS